MPYGYIVIIAMMALTLYLVFATAVSLIAKALVLGVLGACLACLFWLPRFSLAALLLMVGLGIFISLYRICAQARSSNRRD
ncbi:MAG: hypothetical protein ABSD57_10985 [Verrucomicrobiota bacterium]